MKQLVRTLALSATAAFFAQATAWAGGLYVKVKPVADRVADGQAVVLELRATTTVPHSLPASPEVLLEDASGQMTASDLSCAPFETDANGNVALRASASAKGLCELKLGPGSHKLKLRYRLSDGIVDSNTVKLQVGTATADAR